MNLSFANTTDSNEFRIGVHRNVRLTRHYRALFVERVPRVATIAEPSRTPGSAEDRQEVSAAFPSQAAQRASRVGSSGDGVVDYESGALGYDLLYRATAVVTGIPRCWRVVFRWQHGSAFEVAVVDYH